MTSQFVDTTCKDKGLSSDCAGLEDSAFGEKMLANNDLSMGSYIMGSEFTALTYYFSNKAIESDFTPSRTFYDGLAAETMNKVLLSFPTFSTMLKNLDAVTGSSNFDVRTESSANILGGEINCDASFLAGRDTCETTAQIVIDYDFDFTITYNYSYEIADPDPTPAPVPLPASAPLLLVGLGAIAFSRRRKS